MSRKQVNVALLIYFGMIILGLIITMSSCSPEQHARRLVRQAHMKLQRAEQLDPSVIDSVKGVTKIEITVPKDSGSVQPEPEIDLKTFDLTMGEYDSDLLAIDSLDDLLAAGKLSLSTGEAITQAQANMIIALKKTRDKLKNAFLKDTVYRYPDSLVTITVTVKGNKIAGLSYTLHERKVSTTVDTTTINMDGTRVSSPFRQNWFWVMVCLILVLLLIILVISKRR